MTTLIRNPLIWESPPDSINSENTLARPDVRFFVARRDGVAVGCVAVRLYRDYSDVKRLYVADSQRGTGLGRRLMETILETARDKGLGLLRLETGIHNHASLALYHRLGFQPRGPFGTYAPDPVSVFLELRHD